MIPLKLFPRQKEKVFKPQTLQIKHLFWTSLSEKGEKPLMILDEEMSSVVGGRWEKASLILCLALAMNESVGNDRFQLKIW